MARRARAFVTTLMLLFLPLVALASVPAASPDAATQAARARAATGMALRWVALPSESETASGVARDRLPLAVLPSVLVSGGLRPGRATSMARHAHRPDLHLTQQRLPLRTSSRDDFDPH